jgi:acetoin utilization protein AcuB
MIVEMYMNKDVKVISPEASVVEATRKMFQHQIRRLVVTIEESVVGIVCHRDLVNAFPDHVNPFSAFGLSELNLTTKIKEIMKYPVIAVDPGEPIERAARLMIKHRIGVLPVTSNGKLVGIITESDIFRIFTNLLSGEVGSARITFDLTESENILSLLVDVTREFGIDLVSFIPFHEKSRRMAVAWIQGRQVQKVIDELWESGHPIMNIIKYDKVYD